MAKTVCLENAKSYSSVIFSEKVNIMFNDISEAFFLSFLFSQHLENESEV